MSKSSFNGVNYSLRPSKTIQRGLVFEGLRRLQEALNWSKATYVGFGSIWFTDFILAHKALNISRMVSIESDNIGYSRARFNKPYRFIRMKYGLSYDKIPQLYEEVRFPNYPAILWLDYDQRIDSDKLDEIRYIVENATADSVLLVTFDASEKLYGSDPSQVAEYLGVLFDRLAPNNFTREQVRKFGLATTLANLTRDVMISASSKARKSNECLPAFNIVYQDKATMVTVGAAFPSPTTRDDVRRAIAASTWPGVVAEPIIAPHLTSKEASVLQSNLPAGLGMSRDAVRDLGFDLEEEQIKAFERFYRHYPTFAQIIP